MQRPRGSFTAIRPLAFPIATRVLLLAVTVIPILAVLIAGGLLRTVAVLVSAALLGSGVLIAFNGLLQSSRSRGYEILDQEHEWDFVRPDGSLVIHRKRLRVRYLNQAISIVDYAWGQGNLYAEYSCSPGRVVDRLAVDGQLWVLISLGGVRQRGQEEVLEFRRAVTDGFLSSQEWVELKGLEARRVSLKVVFPRERPPEQVQIVRRRESLLGRARERRETVLPDALEETSERKVATVEERIPSLKGSLSLRWDWPPIAIFISHAQAEAGTAKSLAAHLRSFGLVVRTTAETGDVGGSRVAAAHPLSDARAAILVAGNEAPSEQIRSEWSAALENAWGPEPRPVAVLLLAGAKMPAPLRSMPGFRLPESPEDWAATFEHLRTAIWSPTELIRASDFKPSSQERPPVRAALEQGLRDLPVQPEPEKLMKRRRLLEAELAAAQDVGDETAIRRGSYALGLTLAHLGEPLRAREMLERSIELTERQFGSTHPDVADASYNLALTLASLGETEDAAMLLRRAIEVGQAALGPDHPKVRVYRSALAKTEAPSAQGYA
jgi:hypothetical protein